MWNRLSRVLAVLLLLLGGPAAAAEEPPDSLLKRPSPLMDRTEQRLSSRVEAMALRLDRLFGGDDYERRATGTELRLGTRMLWRENEALDAEAIVRLRLRLPHAEERLNLVFESGDDDERRLESEQPPPAAGREREDYRLALRYLRDWADRWNADFDVGIRGGTPIRTFTRGRVGRVFDLGRWQLEPSQSLHWYSDEGLGATSRLLLQRALPADHLFQADTEVAWLRDEGENGTFFYAQDLLVSRQFSPYHALIYQLGVRGESEPDDRVTAYFANVRWRRNLYSDWLFLELKPELMFERETDFEAEPRLQVTVEGWFGGAKSED